MIEAPEITLAMPEGSKWRAYSHKHKVDMGDMTVTKHRQSGMELYSHALEKVVTLHYPANNRWAVEKGHIRLGDADNNLVASYAPTD